MTTQTPIEKLNEYKDYLEDNGCMTCKDGDLLDLIIEVTTQEPNVEGLPTDREILMAINNALYHHFNEEQNI